MEHTLRIDLVDAGSTRDLDEWASVWTRVWPHMGWTARDVHHSMTSVEDVPRRYLIARDGDGSPVGVAYCAASAWLTDATSYGIGVRILPEHRCAGIGTALLDALTEFARAQGATKLSAVISDDEPTVRFWASRGVEQVSRLRHVGVDPRGLLDGPPATVDGVTIAPVGDDPARLRATWTVLSETINDVPSHETYEVPEFDRWLTLQREHHGTDMQRWLLATADATGEPVGFAELMQHSTREHAWMHEYTATMPAWRRRGVATALKEHGIALAAANDVELLLTENDETNVGMRSINERYGYELVESPIVVTGPLPAT